MKQRTSQDKKRRYRRYSPGEASGSETMKPVLDPRSAAGAFVPGAPGSATQPTGQPGASQMPVEDWSRLEAGARAAEAAATGQAALRGGRGTIAIAGAQYQSEASGAGDRRLASGRGAEEAETADVAAAAGRPVQAADAHAARAGGPRRDAHLAGDAARHLNAAGLGAGRAGL